MKNNFLNVLSQRRLSASQSAPGFTVLEFLIVVAIMVVFMSIVLVGLNTSRTRARDEHRIGVVQNIATALGQYFQVCSEYPIGITAAATCRALDVQGKNLGSFLPDADTYLFNQGTLEYRYTALSYRSGTGCTGYHIGTMLEAADSAPATRDGQFNSTGPGVIPCIQTNDGVVATGFDSVPFNGVTSSGGDQIYDIVKQ